MHHLSSGVPDARTCADPLIVAEMEETAVLFICMSIWARELRGPPVGLRSRSAPERVFGGREETQSWTRSETFGLLRRLEVFFEEGFEVITIAGPGGRVEVEGKGCEGR